MPVLKLLKPIQGTELASMIMSQLERELASEPALQESKHWSQAEVQVDLAGVVCTRAGLHSSIKVSLNFGVRVEREMEPRDEKKTLGKASTEAARGEATSHADGANNV